MAGQGHLALAPGADEPRVDEEASRAHQACQVTRCDMSSHLICFAALLLKLASQWL